MKALGTIPLVAAGAGLVIPIYVFAFIILLIMFGSLAVSGLSLVWAVMESVANLLDFIGTRALIILFVVIVIFRIARKQKQENKMFALLRTDPGIRYCNLLMRAGVFHALPISVDDDLASMCETALEERLLDEELEEDHSAHSPAKANEPILAALIREREELCSAFVAAGVDPERFSRYVLTLAARGQLTVWLR